jgi:predicted enzyme related to lactoylglutathione lyase
MGHPVVHFEVMGKDGGALQRYYSELFDWQITPAPGPMDYGLVEQWVNAEGIGIGGGVGAGRDGYGGHVTFYVQVPDVEAALAKAEGLGGKRVSGPDPIPTGQVIGLFADPEGHVIGLVG